MIRPLAASHPATKQKIHSEHDIAMTTTKSAKKRLRQNFVLKGRNLSVKREIRTCIRKVREAVQAGDVDLAENHFRLAAKKLDRAGGRNIIHQNAVARIKSRLSARIKAIKETV